jgi:hypothetical protein
VKRGLITWDKSEIPPEVFERRINRVRTVLAERNLAALLVYSELWRSNQARFFSNYMPYFNRALLVIPQDLPATLLCGLSPRVYGWIRSVTTIEDVRPAGNFAKPLLEMASERNWTRLGALDWPQFPYDIFKSLQSGSVEIVNVESPAVFVPADDATEIAMRKKAASMVREILEEEIPKGVGSVDHHFVGRLERRFRRAGAEDLIVLLTNGDSVPAPPCGATLKENYSVSIALEYRGHWVRTTVGAVYDRMSFVESTKNARSQTAPTDETLEFMGGAYPYECGEGRIPVKHAEQKVNGQRVFRGETIL